MFMCQRNSFLTKYETEIIKCDPVTDLKLLTTTLGISTEKQIGNEDTNVYQLILKDTILFPEGGGQPDDRGTINKAQVIRVVRDGTLAIHYVSASPNQNPLENHLMSWKKGDKVLIEIDWSRRFDHMQQHSGQHLITAVADTMYKFATTSWWLGSEDSYIELDVNDITDEQLKNIEDEVNKKIRECTPVTVDVVELDDPKLQMARGRNLPEDVKGQIRIVTMTNVESNVCCGTHVTNLSQLQVIKLLNVVKKKGKCILYFLSGNRVINRFSQQFQRDQKLMNVLKCPPDEFVIAAEKLNITLKNSRKTCQILSKDLVALEAKKFMENGNITFELRSYHRENVDLEFGNALLREIGPLKSSILMITLKVEGTCGHLILVGGEDVITKENLTKLGEQLCEILDGKGSLRGNLFQAKVNKINTVNKATKAAQEYINQLKCISKN